MSHLDAGGIALLAGAGFAAGGVNVIAGGGSLISFPALLFTGYPALVANVTNTVALIPGYAGGTAGVRSLLGGQGRGSQRSRLPAWRARWSGRSCSRAPRPCRFVAWCRG